MFVAYHVSNRFGEVNVNVLHNVFTIEVLNMQISVNLDE